jgi:hypothetical protein
MHSTFEHSEANLKKCQNLEIFRNLAIFSGFYIFPLLIAPNGMQSVLTFFQLGAGEDLCASGWTKSF